MRLACFQMIFCCSIRKGTLRAARMKWMRKRRKIAGPPIWAPPVASRNAAMALSAPAPKRMLATRIMCIHMNRMRATPESIWSQSR